MRKGTNQQSEMASPEDRALAALREFLADRDVPCPDCKYNLRGLSSANCPECNQPLELRVSLADAAGGAYIATIVGLAAGAGASLLLLLAFVFFAAVEGPPPEQYLELILFGYPLGVLVVLGGFLVRLVSRKGRRRFASLARSTKRYQAVAAWILSLFTFVLWVILIYLNDR